MIRMVLALAIGVMVAGAPAMAAECGTKTTGYCKQKVAYHMNGKGGESEAAYFAALGNVQNHINAVGGAHIEVKVVMHGDGLGLLQSAKDNLRLQGVITNLKNQKVGFVVCKNTLTARKIDPDKDLFDVEAEDIVPSGVAELSALQQKGFTYIKP
ncbi:MAG: hypothetical protein FJX47_04920 [Alphaproteobacteria bacterium]|nr:hypothetical protein [Alphaproteobacteria bacterium]